MTIQKNVILVFITYFVLKEVHSNVLRFFRPHRTKITADQNNKKATVAVFRVGMTTTPAKFHFPRSC